MDREKTETDMRVTNVTRIVDEMGRFRIPVEIRRDMGILKGDEMEIFATDGRIEIKPYDANRTPREYINRAIYLMDNSEYSQKNQAVIKCLKEAQMLLQEKAR